MLQEKDVTITSKGQLTLPAAMRRTMKLGAKRKVRLSMTEPGVVTLRPLADVMSYFGAIKGGPPYDPQEKAKARAAMGRHAARKS